MREVRSEFFRISKIEARAPLIEKLDSDEQTPSSTQERKPKLRARSSVSAIGAKLEGISVGKPALTHACLALGAEE